MNKNFLFVFSRCYVVWGQKIFIIFWDKINPAVTILCSGSLNLSTYSVVIDCVHVNQSLAGILWSDKCKSRQCYPNSWCRDISTKRQRMDKIILSIQNDIFYVSIDWQQTLSALFSCEMNPVRLKYKIKNFIVCT